MRRQYGALCYRHPVGGRLEVLLITSRDTGRWVIPKGWPIKGLTAAQSAAREAFEEAGVTGTVLPDPLGFYRYAKSESSGATIEVGVFPMAVAALMPVFPEAGERRIEWFAPQDAAELVHEPDLAGLIAAFHPERV